MKKSILALVLSAFFAMASNAFAGYASLTVGQRAYLPECGGTVEVNNGGHDNQLNIVFRSVDNCSNFEHFTGKVYKLQGENPNRSGSYTLLTASQYSPGEYTARVYVYSNSKKTMDTVDVKFRINR